MSVADSLEKAADLIEPEGAWTQGCYARLADGETTGSFNPDAVCWCALGAIQKTGGGRDAFSALYDMMPADGLVSPWNDAPERTQAEVVAKLREAAANARGRS
jgi:hypothetical protein